MHLSLEKVGAVFPGVDTMSSARLQEFQPHLATIEHHVGKERCYDLNVSSEKPCVNLIATVTVLKG